MDLAVRFHPFPCSPAAATGSLGINSRASVLEFSHHVWILHRLSCCGMAGPSCSRRGCSDWRYAEAFTDGSAFSPCTSALLLCSRLPGGCPSCDGGWRPNRPFGPTGQLRSCLSCFAARLYSRFAITCSGAIVESGDSAV